MEYEHQTEHDLPWECCCWERERKTCFYITWKATEMVVIKNRKHRLPAQQCRGPILHLQHGIRNMGMELQEAGGVESSDYLLVLAADREISLWCKLARGKIQTTGLWVSTKKSSWRRSLQGKSIWRTVLEKFVAQLCPNVPLRAVLSSLAQCTSKFMVLLCTSQYWPWRMRR